MCSFILQVLAYVIIRLQLAFPFTISLLATISSLLTEVVKRLSYNAHCVLRSKFSVS